MAHNNKFITDEETLNPLYSEMVRNVETTCKKVDMEKGFELYQTMYKYDLFGVADLDFIFASKSDEEAIKTSLDREKEEQKTDETFKCKYIVRIGVRENGLPLMVIIWQDEYKS